MSIATGTQGPRSHQARSKSVCAWCDVCVWVVWCVCMGGVMCVWVCVCVCVCVCEGGCDKRCSIHPLLIYNYAAMIPNEYLV